MLPCNTYKKHRAPLDLTATLTLMTALPTQMTMPVPLLAVIAGVDAPEAKHQAEAGDEAAAEQAGLDYKLLVSKDYK